MDVHLPRCERGPSRQKARVLEPRRRVEPLLPHINLALGRAHEYPRVVLLHVVRLPWPAPFACFLAVRGRRLAVHGVNGAPRLLVRHDPILHDDLVLFSLLGREVLDDLLVQHLPGAVREVQLPAGAVVQPHEEVLPARGLLPDLVVPGKVGAVPVLRVHGLEPVLLLQRHRLDRGYVHRLLPHHPLRAQERDLLPRRSPVSRGPRRGQAPAAQGPRHPPADGRGLPHDPLPPEHVHRPPHARSEVQRGGASAQARHSARYRRRSRRAGGRDFLFLWCPFLLPPRQAHQNMKGIHRASQSASEGSFERSRDALPNRRPPWLVLDSGSGLLHLTGGGVSSRTPP
mmetsp:Transcript_928/g.2760  ORF Transcript_928/g.2760 Transcript_928/m.2760 type:complete len:343 (+) Transcript_928:1636-2664(+)